MNPQDKIIEALRSQAGDAALFERTKDVALDYMHTVRDRHVFPKASDVEGLRVFQETLPEGPAAPQEIVEMLHRFGSPGTSAQTGGRYFGFVNGGVLPAALAARWLSDAWDQNAAMYVISPIASVLESVCEQWLIDLLGLPEGTAAGFVGGTSLASLSGLAAGRDELLRRCGWDAGKKGLFGAPEIRVIIGAQAHSSIYKALSLLGLGRERTTVAPTDDQGRMDPDRLPDLDDRTLLILQAGNVNSGAFDPFTRICEKAGKADAWVHVDGAFGLWAAASGRSKHLTEGIQLADSWSVDAHKTLNAPYDNGIVFCRNREALTRAMTMTGAYIVFSENRDGMLYTPEMSRRARGVEIWAALKSLGRRGTAALIDDLCDKAAYFSTCLQKEGFSILNDVCFNQVIVACEDPGKTLKTLENVQKSGECWCGGTIWKNEPAIRISVCSFMTTRQDIERSVRAFVSARQSAGTV